MPYYFRYRADGTRVSVRGDLGPHCADCADVGWNLCDYPVGDDKTCDRAICDLHGHEIGPNMHYCATHHAEWTAFRDAGGVREALENVVPFAPCAPAN
jgi:hypothetical protein